jgi:hypothetical protein
VTADYPFNHALMGKVIEPAIFAVTLTGGIE